MHVQRRKMLAIAVLLLVVGIAGYLYLYNTLAPVREQAWRRMTEIHTQLESDLTRVARP